jgi:hypothetical protein
MNERKEGRNRERKKGSRYIVWMDRRNEWVGRRTNTRNSQV